MPNDFKCPFCKKTSDKKWIIVNHIRQSRSGEHGPMGELPEGFNPQTLENVKPDIQPSTPDEVKHENNVNTTVELINPPKKKKINILVCPECETPKSEWININQVDEATAEERQVYDYCCPNCKELIRLNE